MTNWTPDVIDLQMIREFSTNGVQLSGPISSDQRRDRIRVEIWRNRRQIEQFYDSHMTYAEAYFLAYGKPLELRGVPRDHLGRPAIALVVDEDDEEEEA